MGSERDATIPSPPTAKRSRDPEDEVYLDKLHTHKRYLSEVMASSLNGLTVEDSLSDNLMESPLRDEVFTDYSPMSEDYDDSRYNYEISSTQAEDAPTSPMYKCQKVAGFAPSPFTNSHRTRHPGTDAECRFPSSPSDICHLADLRKAALLRSVQMKARPVVEERAVVYRVVDEFGMAEHEKQKSCSNTDHEFERELGE